MMHEFILTILVDEQKHIHHLAFYQRKQQRSKTVGVKLVARYPQEEKDRHSHMKPCTQRPSEDKGHIMSSTRGQKKEEKKKKQKEKRTKKKKKMNKKHTTKKKHPKTTQKTKKHKKNFWWLCSQLSGVPNTLPSYTEPKRWRKTCSAHKVYSGC